MRSYSSLSTANQKKLQEYMAQIDDWVHDSNSGERLILDIQSYGLKKALGKYNLSGLTDFLFREVTKVYIGKGVFTEFQRNTTETVIKKTKTFKQTKFLRGFSSADDNNSQCSLGF